MDFLPLLAQEAAPLAEPSRRPLQRILEIYPPAIAAPIFVAVVVVTALVVERIAVVVLRRMASKTATKMDDAFVECLPTLMRPLCVLISLHIVVQQCMHDEKRQKLSPEGEFVAKVLMVVSIIVLSIAIVRAGMKIIDAWAQSGPDRHMLGSSIKLGVKIAMVPVAFLAVLQAIEYPIASLVTALGLGSLAVGLALQDTLKNMFAGVQIVLDRPIRSGDFVEIDKNTRGIVLEVGLRSTKLRSVDNNIVVIPNGTIANATIVNFDIQDRRVCQFLTISVEYGVDTRRVQKVLEEVVKQAQRELPAISDDPPRVVLRDLGESGINFSIEVTFRQFVGRLETVTELYHRCYDRLRAERIGIPFPTRTVYVRQEDAATAAVSKPSR
jgi:small-conductance mechanosensitive channel